MDHITLDALEKNRKEQKNAIMKRHSVNSSMAVSVGYDPATSTLEIEFKSGEVWQYHAVPKRVYTELLKDSIGKYFQAHIKGMYSESRIR